MLIAKYVFVIFLSIFVIRHFRGKCSSLEMLKGYMARDSLETSGLGSRPKRSIKPCLCFLIFHGELSSYTNQTSRPVC